MESFMNFFSDDARRNPYPLYQQARTKSPLLLDPHSGLWMLFDFDSVKQVLSDPATFSSRFGPDWLIFTDPPRHSKLRALVSKAFTPRSIVNLEPRIRAISRNLLQGRVEMGEMDLAADFSVPLPMKVIAEMLGIPACDHHRLKRWVDVILRMSYTIGQKGPDAASATSDFTDVTLEMSEYLADFLKGQKASPGDNLLSRLAQAEVDGERLTHAEILGFLQLLLLGGSETTTNLINNAILCFIENPSQLDLLRQDMELLPGAIEEVLRYRSPVQWIYRVTRREVEMHGQIIGPSRLVLAVIGSANHDPAQFANPERFDITRDPNPHIGFGNGMHFCLGSALARLEARIALTDLLERLSDIQLADSQPWPPREGLHVHGPARLPIRFKVNARG
jgi:cytochrome P450